MRSERRAEEIGCRSDYGSEWGVRVGQLPADLYGEEAMRELGDKARWLREQEGWGWEGGGGRGGWGRGGGAGRGPDEGRRGYPDVGLRRVQPRVPRGPRALPSNPNQQQLNSNYSTGYVSFSALAH